MISLQYTVLLVIVLSIIIMFVLYTKEGFELIYPGPASGVGCMDAKVQDLKNAFGGDVNKLKSVMYETGVPMNLPLTDENAPEIATYLVNNKTVGDFAGCKLVNESVFPFAST